MSQIQTALFRATKDGYDSTCRINDCGPPKWIKVLDSIPAAIPLLVDLAAGALGNCDDMKLTMDPVRFKDMTFDLPSDDEILANPGMCAFPYLYDDKFAAKAEHIIVSTGALQQRYDILGNVDFGGLGFERTTPPASAVMWTPRLSSNPIAASAMRWIEQVLRGALYRRERSPGNNLAATSPARTCMAPLVREGPKLALSLDPARRWISALIAAPHQGNHSKRL